MGVNKDPVATISNILVDDVLQYLCLWLDPRSLSNFHQVCHSVNSVTMMQELWVHSLAASTLHEHHSVTLSRAKLFDLPIRAGPRLKFLVSPLHSADCDSSEVESACSDASVKSKSFNAFKRLSSRSSIRSWISTKASDAGAPLRRRGSSGNNSRRSNNQLPAPSEPEVNHSRSRNPSQEASAISNAARRISGTISKLLERNSVRKSATKIESQATIIGREIPVDAQVCKLQALCRFLDKESSLPSAQRPWLPEVVSELATLAGANGNAAAVALLCNAKVTVRSVGTTTPEVEMLVGPAVFGDMLTQSADMGLLEVTQAILSVESTCTISRLSDVVIERAIEAGTKTGRTTSVAFLFGAYFTALVRSGFGTYQRMMKVSRMLQVGIRIAVEGDQGALLTNLLLMLRARSSTPEFVEHLPEFFSQQFMNAVRSSASMGHHATIKRLFDHPALGELMTDKEVIDSIMLAVTRNARKEVLDELSKRDLLTPKMVADAMLAATIREFGGALDMLLATDMVTQPCLEVCMSEALRRGHDGIVDILEQSMKGTS